MRLISPRGFRARIVLLTIGLVTVFGPYRVGADAEDAQPAGVRREPGRISFTDRQRQAIDEAALGSLRIGDIPARAAAYGDVVEWLVARTPLPEEEFRRRAAARDAEVVKTFSTADAPEAAEAIFAKLVDALPARMRPQRDRFALVVVENSPKDSFTTGVGRVYLNKAFLESTLADRQSGAEQVAMAAAHELGHVCRRHVRHKFQRQWLEREIGRDIDASRRVDRKETTKTAVRGAGTLLESLYAPDEDFEADLFALHLCRNAGFDLEDCLDVFRRRAVRDDAKPSPAAGRLARLRVELDGTGYAKPYGLFRFDPQSKTLKRAADGSVPRSALGVVCIHGLESDLQVHLALMSRLAASPSGGDLHVLGFRYPRDDSLSRASKFLAREMQRVCPNADNVDFVCHSAGGLVFRYYAEIERGGFRRVVFQGTPHRGSDLAGLRPLLEVKRFFGDLDLGYSQSLSEAIVEGRGQITFDLQPDSLFLGYLNRPRAGVHLDRYTVYRGLALKPSRALLLQAAVSATRRGLIKRLGDKDSTQAKFARASVEKLKLPAEVTRGDLAVTLQSAVPHGVDRVRTFPLNHFQLPRDAELVEEIALALTGQHDPNR